jgi:hypothetical protein
MVDAFEVESDAHAIAGGGPEIIEQDGLAHAAADSGSDALEPIGKGRARPPPCKEFAGVPPDGDRSAMINE